MRRKADVLAGMFRQPETRRLFQEFIEWVIKKGVANKALGPLPRFADVMRQLDRGLPDGAVMQPKHITDVLTTDALRRAGLLAIFLSELGLVAHSTHARTDSSDARRIQDILREVQKASWASLVRQYAEELASPGRGLRPRTQRVYLRAAVELLKFSKVSQAGELTSSHVRRFLRSRPGQRTSLFPWLAFLSGHTGRMISNTKKSTSKGLTIKSQTHSVAQLLALIKRTTSKRGRLAITAKLLSVLYGVPLEHILEMNRSCTDLSGDAIRLRFGGDWVSVDATTGELLRNIFVELSGDHDARLFPGRLKGDGLSVSGVVYHLRDIAKIPQHIGASEGFKTHSE